jgi:succinate dehydrogenase/fumarate reductase flavoprotein subunit
MKKSCRLTSALQRNYFSLIRRLYAAGELGSLFAWLYEAGGGLAECIVFGKIAGHNAAAEKPVSSW